MTIKRISPMSAAKIQGILGAGIGLVLGALFSLIGMVGGMASGLASGDGGGALPGMLFGIGAIIVLPIFYGICGFIGGAIGAWLFNLAAGWVGGLEIEAA